MNTVPVIVSNFAMFYSHTQARAKLPKKRRRIMPVEHLPRSLAVRTNPNQLHHHAAASRVPANLNLVAGPGRPAANPLASAGSSNFALYAPGAMITPAAAGGLGLAGGIYTLGGGPFSSSSAAAAAPSGSAATGTGGGGFVLATGSSKTPNLVPRGATLESRQRINLNKDLLPELGPYMSQRQSSNDSAATIGSQQQATQLSNSNNKQVTQVTQATQQRQPTPPKTNSPIEQAGESEATSSRVGPLAQSMNKMQNVTETSTIEISRPTCSVDIHRPTKISMDEKRDSSELVTGKVEQKVGSNINGKEPERDKPEHGATTTSDREKGTKQTQDGKPTKRLVVSDIGGREEEKDREKGASLSESPSSSSVQNLTRSRESSSCLLCIGNLGSNVGAERVGYNTPTAQITGSDTPARTEARISCSSLSHNTTVGAATQQGSHRSGRSHGRRHLYSCNDPTCQAALSKQQAIQGSLVKSSTVCCNNPNNDNDNHHSVNKQQQQGSNRHREKYEKELVTTTTTTTRTDSVEHLARSLRSHQELEADRNTSVSNEMADVGESKISKKGSRKGRTNNNNNNSNNMRPANIIIGQTPGDVECIDCARSGPCCTQATSISHEKGGTRLAKPTEALTGSESKTDKLEGKGNAGVKEDEEEEEEEEESHSCRDKLSGVISSERKDSSDHSTVL